MCNLNFNLKDWEVEGLKNGGWEVRGCEIRGSERVDGTVKGRDG